ncbi:hypothetical protein BESB_038860 [Besnoitia besnoiti]|uniref:Transmembrane protein n=1 Tax=Besnoitia besnoiti TaxID=94643 RepID=A0A2A9MFZ2_BESBE|nr:hypothetical protein BESB_038860 [Besnoitia besnoiti]PFH37428.1 hypothetical protein BESB_038860 [Besnoitia besnoiti]
MCVFHNIKVMLWLMIGALVVMPFVVQGGHAAGHFFSKDANLDSAAFEHHSLQRLSPVPHFMSPQRPGNENFPSSTVAAPVAQNVGLQYPPW